LLTKAGAELQDTREYVAHWWKVNERAIHGLVLLDE
jgi:hypothetical protein